jgi:hypothetical protein
MRSPKKLTLHKTTIRHTSEQQQNIVLVDLQKVIGGGCAKSGLDGFCGAGGAPRRARRLARRR